MPSMHIINQSMHHHNMHFGKKKKQQEARSVLSTYNYDTNKKNNCIDKNGQK